ncbi:MAG: DinB family protein [Thermoflexales bacterium]|nr:DinB family protein [Thermoflexales bacterium]MDW8351310.1 DinB family protein [Anaerolineae bacterium]
MNKAELIARIESERRALEEVLARVPPEEMHTAGVVGHWSVKDTLAHIAMWYSRAVTLLFQAERGQALQLPRSNAPDWADINAQDYASQKDRPIERIQADFRGAHQQLIKRLNAWTDEAMLFDSRRYPPLKGRALADYLWDYTGGHSAEHRAQIEAWLAARSSAAHRS